jgi:hypothetical protein
MVKFKVNEHSINFRGLKAAPQLLMCFSVFFCFCAQVAVLRAQEWEESASRPAIGMRLPQTLPGWVQELDPRVFPFEQTPNRGLSLRGEVSPATDWRPFSLKRRVEIDSTGKFFVASEEINGLPLRPAYVVPVKDIVSQRLAYEQALAWHKAAAGNIYRAGEDERRGPGGVSIDIPVAIKSRAFEQIFGGNTVGLNVQGDITIKGGFRNEKRSEVKTAYTRGSDFSFKMQQTQRFTVTGRIGDKVTVNVDQDSERAFDFENNIKLNYTGYDDDVVQKIEAGNVALSLPGTRFVTYGGSSAGLFGIKSEMQLGNLAITAIASQEKGENKKLTLSGGATEGSQKIQDYEYRRFTYFFLDTLYRAQYRYYARKWVHTYDVPQVFGGQRGTGVSRIEVYRSRGGDDRDPKAIPGQAYRDPNPLSNPTTPDSTESYSGYFIRLDPSTDYYIEKTLGYIVMTNPLGPEEVLAVAYQDSGAFYSRAPRTVGDIDYTPSNDPQNPKTIRLKLIKPRGPVPPQPPDRNHTWHLEWKNVYYLGSRNIPPEDFQLKLFYKPPAGEPQETFTDNGTARSFLNVFGLDERDNSGAFRPDNIIDNDLAIVNLARGELIFPDLEPFEPDGVIVNSVQEASKLPKELYVSTMYRSSVQTDIYRDSKFYIEVKSKNRSTSYNLGFNVIEGSEEVLLDGRKLTRDVDYNIDYFSGNLVVLNEEATKPGHNLEISYQGNQLFQLEKKTIIGTRAEYRINPNSFIGGTLMYLNATTLDQRVRLGSVDKGPMKNLIWDFNTALRFQPNFLTRALNALPVISTQEPSDLRFEGEIAQIIPNPNTIDSKLSKENRIPGDKDGLAYIDDFEATKRTTSLNVNRRAWLDASIPLSILKDPNNPQPPDNLGLKDERRALARRGKLLWYNPFRGVATLAIYPGRTQEQIDAGNATTQVLTMVFDPTKTVENTGLEPSKSWGGIMRALSPGFFDQNESKFIELWFKGTTGRLHIELGRISEDAIPNGKLNTEDTKGGVRNGVLDDGEDVGLDGVAGKDPADFWDLVNLGTRDWGEPLSNDDWFYRFENEQDKYATANGTVNGTENSKNDGNESGGSIRPDSEDINANGDVDRDNDYFSYVIDLNPAGPDTAFLEGGALNDWKLYRIPLAQGDSTGNPTLSRIEYVRLWVDGFTRRDSIMIAEINLAGNEWKEVGIGKVDGTVFNYDKQDKRLEVTVINTDENTEYRNSLDQLPGVAGELDPVRRIRVKEQSQVVRVTNLGGGEIAAAQKTFYQPLNLLNYNSVKMFVYGKDVKPNDNIEFFIRFGADTSNYYEFRERVALGWSQQNTMNLDLVALASTKLALYITTVLDTSKFESVNSFKDYFRVKDAKLLQNLGLNAATQEVRVRGNPALTNVRTLIVGIKNAGTASFTGEIWMNELRVTNVKKDKGIAMRARIDLKLADFINFGGEINQRDADFHNVADRFGSGNSEQSYSLNGSMTLDKILPQGLGLSVPVNMTYSYRQATPKYVPGTDIQAINNDRIRKSFVNDTIRAVTKQSSVNFSIRRRSRSQNFFIKNTIDNLAGSLSYTQSSATSSQIALSKRVGWSGDASYNLTFGSKNFIQPFKWIGKAPLLGKLTNTKLYYIPFQSFSAQLQASNTKDSSQTQILDPRTYKISKGLLSSVSTYTATHSYRTSIKLVENMSIDFSRTFTSDLLNRLRVFNQRRNRDTLSAFSNLAPPKAGLMSLLTGDNEVVSMTQAFGARYTPNLFNWFNPNFSYSANYNYTNSIQQGSIGRRAGTNTSLTANGSLRFAELFSIFKRKQSTPSRETPGRPRQEPRIPPGGQQKPERPREEGEEEREPEQAPPEQEPKRQPQEKQDKQEQPEKKAKEDKPGRSISPMAILRFFGKFKDVSMNYSRTESFAHSALDSSKTPKLAYQLGFLPRPGVATVRGITTTPRIYQRGDNYSFSSGLDLGRNFNMTLRFEHDQRKNESTTKTGSSLNSWMLFGKPSSYADQKSGLPFPEWTVTVSGLERLNPFNKFASSLSLSHGFGGKLTQTWRDNPNNITDRDFSLNFRPLIKVNLSWKNGMVSTLQYNKTSGDRPTYIFSSEERAQIEQGAQITRNTDISFTTTYSKQSGFRLPLPFLKNKELRNSVDLSITFLRNISETAQRRSGIAGEVGGQKTTRWSFSPRMTYSFSNRVRGGANFEIGQTKSLLSGTTNIKELGIDINISIRGE